MMGLGGEDEFAKDFITAVCDSLSVLERRECFASPRKADPIFLAWRRLGIRPLKQHEVGALYGISRERVRQLEHGGLQRLRDSKNALGPGDATWSRPKRLPARNGLTDAEKRRAEKLRDGGLTFPEISRVLGTCTEIARRAALGLS